MSHANPSDSPAMTGWREILYGTEPFGPALWAAPIAALLAVFFFLVYLWLAGMVEWVS